MKDNLDEKIIEMRIEPDSESIRDKWDYRINAVLTKATLSVPQVNTAPYKTNRKQHTEHLGRLLSEMQITARSFPGVKW